MRLLENMNYWLTDRRKKMTLIVAIFAAILVIIIQSYLINQRPTKMVLIASNEINMGDFLTAENTKEMEVNETDFNDYEYIADYKGMVAVKNHLPGQLILKRSVVEESEYIAVEDDQRLVTIKLSIEEADGWCGEIGEIVEVSHFDKDKINPLKIFKGVRVYNLLRINENDDYPAFAVMLVTEEQRDYILANRNIGIFEISN